jgi:hypothetical protein
MLKQPKIGVCSKFLKDGNSLHFISNEAGNGMQFICDVVINDVPYSSRTCTTNHAKNHLTFPTSSSGAPTHTCSVAADVNL